MAHRSYDKLVVAVGAPSDTKGIPGVQEHALFLKEVEDALSIRRRLSDIFETAALPGDVQPEIYFRANWATRTIDCGVDSKDL